MAINFKKYEVSGVNKAEAISKLSDVFTVSAEGTIKGDATQKWKNAKKKVAEEGGAWTSAVEKEFMAEYLVGKKAIAGEAYSITVVPAVENTRERPYKNENVKNEDGSRDFDKAFEIRDAKTGEVVKTLTTKIGKIDQKVYETDADGEFVLDEDGKKVVALDEDGNPKTVKVAGKIRPTKAEAVKAADELIIKGYRGSLEIHEIRETPNSLVARVIYTPSSKCTSGTYIVFGIEKQA